MASGAVVSRPPSARDPNSSFSGLARSQRRGFWSERRLFQLEAECNEPQNKANPAKQRELYKELLRTGNYSALISRFENQPQLSAASVRYPAAARAEDARRIQQDPESLRAYITALSKDGKIDRLALRVSSIVANTHLYGTAPPLSPAAHAAMLASSGGSAPLPNGGSGAAHASADTDADGARLTGTVSEGREHLVRTNIAEWERALGARLPIAPQPARSTAVSTSASGAFQRRAVSAGARNESLPPHPEGQPIQVVISEAWSWSKFSRKMGSRLLYGVLIMTGLSVVLDQQGVLKSAAMSSGEVEPSSVNQTITFSDVQGVDEAKQELEEIVEFLREPSKFMELGGKLPKGILLYGPPGTGKTHLARAVAGEAGVPFFQMSGSEFDELYVGVGARRVRELFASAKKRAPCIVFIDELDAVGSKRSTKDQSYMRQTLNQLLVELDGFSSTEGVILIAATNTPESLDKALVRPGRFDRLVPVPLPDVKGRTQILKVHMRDVQMAPSVDVEVLARGTPGFSGADLANLINQAAIKASKENSRQVNMSHLEWAKDKIIMGSEKKSAVITEENKRLTAYHEGGHTLAALYTQGAMPLHKVTVIPRGNALGVTVQLPEADKTNHTRKELLAMLDVCMGGRVAEELIFGADEVTTGASSDLQKATSIAREMIMSYGMSDKVGLQSFSQESFEQASSQTRALVEAEVKALLESSYSRTMSLMRTHKEELHRLAKALVEHETLSLDEVKLAIKGADLTKKPADATQASSPQSKPNKAK
ncbi:i-AAA protease yme1 [Polyrhizophydium stewartii]|uniref:I-AAA protease yme1 n=1 Tax=Polyrhizophydium stewartii TaxID=2732419 RepID=A0ABR4N260_9FUNG|nr:hypothetical protein HK105_006233 [Polyrhizophydium stewartii]